MNYLHFLAFFVFAFSALVSGIWIHSFANKNKESILNRGVYLGETLLLGSSWIVGIMMLLGLLHLYRPLPLWGFIFANFLFFADKNVRAVFKVNIFRKVRFDLPLGAFCLFMAFFIFRNCFFLLDIDSILGYAFTHKVWLAAGTNLTGNDMSCWPIFLPQYDSVPYALGFALFGDNSLFAGLVSTYWRVIAALLLFGYASYRFNRWYGLAAVFLMLLDTHMFYSGLNSWVIINCALVALGFAAAYNLWEARAGNSSFRFVLGFIFLSQMPANKYQSIWMVIFLTAMGIGFQSNPLEKIRAVLREKRWLIPLLAAAVFTSIWYIKNIALTGTPLFFKFAGDVGGLGWTPEQEKVFLTLLGGLPFSKALKYLSFNFIWAGVYALKYLWSVVCFLPILLSIVLLRNKVDRNALIEFLFWLGLVVLAVLGVTLAAYYDPRYYRFPMGILAFTAIMSVNFILTQCFRIRNRWVLTVIILGLSLPGYEIAFVQGGGYRFPTIRDNVNILTNKISFEDVMERYYPDVRQISELLAKNPEKADSLAYYIADDMQFSLLFLPIKPIVSVWRSSLVKWDSYNSEDRIIKDLRDHGIEWVLVEKPAPDGFVIQPIKEFAKVLKAVDRYPKDAFNVGDYGFPSELQEMKY